MKKLSFVLACFASGISLAPASTVLARWTFETNVLAGATDAAELGPIAADEGAGTAHGVHASSSTDYSTPTGNGSANALSSNNWRQGDYYEFRVATLNYVDIVVTWDQARTSTGPSTFDFEYSVDGVSYTAFLSGYTVLTTVAPNAWSSAVPNGLFGFTADLSGVAAVEQVAELRLRLRQTETGIAATGGNRVDNVVVSAIPEPGAGLLGAAAGLGLLRRRRGAVGGAVGGAMGGGV